MPKGNFTGNQFNPKPKKLTLVYLPRMRGGKPINPEELPLYQRYRRVAHLMRSRGMTEEQAIAHHDRPLGTCADCGAEAMKPTWTVCQKCRVARNNAYEKTLRDRAVDRVCKKCKQAFKGPRYRVNCDGCSRNRHGKAESPEEIKERKAAYWLKYKESRVRATNIKKQERKKKALPKTWEDPNIAAQNKLAKMLAANTKPAPIDVAKAGVTVTRIAPRVSGLRDFFGEHGGATAMDLELAY